MLTVIPPTSLVTISQTSNSCRNGSRLTRQSESFKLLVRSLFGYAYTTVNLITVRKACFCRVAAYKTFRLWKSFPYESSVWKIFPYASSVWKSFPYASSSIGFLCASSVWKSFPYGYTKLVVRGSFPDCYKLTVHIHSRQTRQIYLLVDLARLFYLRECNESEKANIHKLTDTL